MVDEAVKRVFALSKQDIYFIIIIVMLAVNMAFNFSLVEPVRNFRKPYRRNRKTRSGQCLKISGTRMEVILHYT